MTEQGKGPDLLLPVEREMPVLVGALEVRALVEFRPEALALVQVRPVE